MSRIDNATLIVTTKAGSVAYNDAANITTEDVTLANIAGNLTNMLIFAESFNVLRVMSGMGGLTNTRGLRAAAKHSLLVRFSMNILQHTLMREHPKTQCTKRLLETMAWPRKRTRVW